MPSDSDYIADSETVTEMMRLLEQDVLLTCKVSGLLPPGVDPALIHEVLDIGCGPGGWVLELAKAYPHLHVTGIDSSELVIDFAQAKAEMEGVPNAHFQVMNFRELTFPDASFDVVNARLVQWFLNADEREPVVQGWWRVVRPGGVIRFTENEIGAMMTNSETMARSMRVFLSALAHAGRTIAPDGGGITLLLRPLLRNLGCQDIGEMAHLVNFSAGEPFSEVMCGDIIKGMETMAPFIVKAKVVGKKKLAEIYLQARQDMASPDFLGMIFYVSAWGRKPHSGADVAMNTGNVLNW
jgi:ubiquinone/menaquinone biosynthesis C-methylase UbiE